MTLDVPAIRAQFPSLASGIAFFDGPGGTQTPKPVIDAIAATLAAPLSNRGSITEGERNAGTTVVEARQALTDLLNAPTIVFGRSATQLTYDFSRLLSTTWSPGDEVVVTKLDHDANVRPWVQAAKHAGATLRWTDFDPATGELATPDLTPRTKLVAVTAASNLIGTRPDLPEIARAVHAVGALLFVDGVHYTAHASVDVQAMGADFFTCSPYKFLGPHIGVLASRPELLEPLHPDKLLPAPDHIPERFEHGTLPYELLAGTRAAIDFLASLTPHQGDRRTRLITAFAALEHQENALRDRIETAVSTLDGITVHSRAEHRTPTLLLTFNDHRAADAHRFLAERRIQAPAGSFYAIETSRHLGLADKGGLRIGLAPYNNPEDTDRLLQALTDFLH